VTFRTLHQHEKVLEQRFFSPVHRRMIRAFFKVKSYDPHSFSV